MTDLTTSELKSKELQYNKLQNESGEGFNPYTVELEKRGLAEFDKLVSAEHAEWTLEVTIARRQEFNSKKPTGATLKRIESELGYTMLNLQNAVKRHGL